MRSTHDGIVHLAQELTVQDSKKNDFIPRSSQIKMHEDGKGISVGNLGAFGVTRLFETQLATRCGIPQKYYDFTASIEGLKALNVNKILAHVDERRTVRTLDGVARAYLSDRYKPIDNLFVLQPFLEVLKEHKKKGGTFEIKATALSPSRMCVEVFFPNITGEIVSVGRGKEKINAGIALTNSEVGLGSFDVRSFLWWQWCSNGAIAQSLMRKYHAGGRRVGDDEEDYSVYSDKTIRLEMEAFQSRLTDIIKYSITDENFQEVIRKIQRTTEDKVEHPTTLIRNVTKRFQLNEGMGEKILKNMADEGNMNRYGLLNGITRLAQEVSDPDLSYSLETVGNDVILLKPSEWKVLSEKDEDEE